jgi:hypothetical protein
MIKTVLAVNDVTTTKRGKYYDNIKRKRRRRKHAIINFPF